MFFKSFSFTSGTTSGTFSVIRNALVLSTTIAPRFAASGANCFDTDPPALNSAISTPSKLSGLPLEL